MDLAWCARRGEACSEAHLMMPAVAFKKLGDEQGSTVWLPRALCMLTKRLKRLRDANCSSSFDMVSLRAAALGSGSADGVVAPLAPLAINLLMHAL